MSYFHNIIAISILSCKLILLMWRDDEGSRYGGYLWLNICWKASAVRIIKSSTWAHIINDIAFFRMMKQCYPIKKISIRRIESAATDASESTTMIPTSAMSTRSQKISSPRVCDTCYYYTNSKLTYHSQAPWYPSWLRPTLILRMLNYSSGMLW